MVEMKPLKDWNLDNTDGLELIGTIDASTVLEFDDDLDRLVAESVYAVKKIEQILSDRLQVLSSSLDPRLAKATSSVRGAMSNMAIAEVKVTRAAVQLSDMNQIIQGRNEVVKSTRRSEQ